jgi:murein DD-endopeptidase MepM/ murein hydrolase activator NlpD
VRRRLISAALAALVLSGAAASGAAPSSSPTEHAAAFAIAVRIPGEAEASAGVVSAPPQASATVGDYAYPADGSVVSAGVAYTSARTGPGASPHAEASASVERVSVLGGEIEIAVAGADAAGTARAGSADGDLSGSRLEGLVVLGEKVPVAANTRVALGDWGYAVLLEQAVLREDAEGPGYRGAVTALHVFLTAEHGGLPAGSEILIGYAEASVRGAAPPAAEEVPPPAGSPDDGGGTPPREPVVRPPGSSQEPPAIVKNPPANVRPDITGRGYVFPVYGPASFSDDFGAPRANTVWHHGNDIFAPSGAPVLAVADGTLFSVGWNQVGGWRLWLRDEKGNEYYYAHLSAYSPLAVDGARVGAGDVIAFVGDTGDAQGTPSHLHFEIHPAALLGLGYDGVINPYPYLLAWHQRRDESFSAAAAAVAEGATPGALLLDAEDISSASGLYPGALLELLGLTGEESRLLAAAPPPLVPSPSG